MDIWKRAVIHLECAADSEHFYDRIKRIEHLRKEVEEGKITHQEFAELISGKSRDLRYHGTALFLSHEGRHYLITARHVLWDKHSAEREYQEEVERVKQWPENMRRSLLESANRTMFDKIFGIIFRVPSLDEALHAKSDTNKAFLMNLGAGTSFTAPYTFSNPEIDLAVISLSQRNSEFAKELISLGYKPISLTDIGEEPTKEGAEVLTVGFPSSTALLAQGNQTAWSSGFFSLPILSFGRVSMLHDALPFYWADMSIYPGNSGGPVIEDNKLVGIVSGQPAIGIEESNLEVRIPFGGIVKTKYVFKLLSIQEQKDSHTRPRQVAV